MKYPMYAIRDVKTSFLPPQLAMNDEDSIRQFAMMVNSPEKVYGFQPKDFDLYQVGSFDTEKGVLEVESPIRFVVAGSALVNRDEK